MPEGPVTVSDLPILNGGSATGRAVSGYILEQSPSMLSSMGVFSKSGRLLGHRVYRSLRHLGSTIGVRGHCPNLLRPAGWGGVSVSPFKECTSHGDMDGDK